eukprot:5640165-Amphidinium_carterae.3
MPDGKVSAGLQPRRVEQLLKDANSPMDQKKIGPLDGLSQNMWPYRSRHGHCSCGFRNLYLSGDVGGLVSEPLWHLAPREREGEAAVPLYPVPQSEGCILTASGDHEQPPTTGWRGGNILQLPQILRSRSTIGPADSRRALSCEMMDVLGRFVRGNQQNARGTAS